MYRIEDILQFNRWFVVIAPVIAVISGAGVGDRPTTAVFWVLALFLALKDRVFERVPGGFDGGEGCSVRWLGCLSSTQTN